MDGLGLSWGEMSSCVIFLFQNYELNSIGLLISAYIITIAFGLVVHLCGFLRLKVKRCIVGEVYGLRVLQSFLYTVQVAAGYFLMLVVMT